MLNRIPLMSRSRTLIPLLMGVSLSMTVIWVLTRDIDGTSMLPMWLVFAAYYSLPALILLDGSWNVTDQQTEADFTRIRLLTLISGLSGCALLIPPSGDEKNLFNFLRELAAISHFVFLVLATQKLVQTRSDIPTGHTVLRIVGVAATVAAWTFFPNGNAATIIILLIIKGAVFIDISQQIQRLLPLRLRAK